VLRFTKIYFILETMVKCKVCKKELLGEELNRWLREGSKARYCSDCYQEEEQTKSENKHVFVGREVLNLFA
jgi:hypothetical protein